MEGCGVGVEWTPVFDDGVGCDAVGEARMLNAFKYASLMSKYIRGFNN